MKDESDLKCWIVGLVCIPGESRGAINCSSWLCWRSRLEQRIGYMEQSIWFQGKSIPNTSWRKYWTGQYLNNSNQTLFPYFLLNSPSYTINVYVCVCVCVCVCIYIHYTHIYLRNCRGAWIPRTKLSVGRDIKNKIVFHCVYFVSNVRSILNYLNWKTSKFIRNS